MIDYTAAAFLVIGFIAILKGLNVVENSARAITITKRAIADLRSSEMEDEVKEVAMQTHAKHLFGLFLLITLSGFAALLIPLAVIWILDRLQLLSLDAVLDATVSWQFITASTVIVILILFAMRSRRA